MGILLTVTLLVLIFFCPAVTADEENAIEEGNTQQELYDTRERLQRLREKSDPKKYGNEDDGIDLSIEDIDMESPDQAP